MIRPQLAVVPLTRCSNASRQSRQVTVVWSHRLPEIFLSRCKKLQIGKPFSNKGKYSEMLRSEWRRGRPRTRNWLVRVVPRSLSKNLWKCLLTHRKLASRWEQAYLGLRQSRGWMPTCLAVWWNNRLRRPNRPLEKLANLRNGCTCWSSKTIRTLRGASIRTNRRSALLRFGLCDCICREGLWSCLLCSGWKNIKSRWH